jgi:hypothetical protein
VENARCVAHTPGGCLTSGASFFCLSLLLLLPFFFPPSHSTMTKPRTTLAIFVSLHALLLFPFFFLMGSYCGSRNESLSSFIRAGLHLLLSYTIPECAHLVYAFRVFMTVDAWLLDLANRIARHKLHRVSKMHFVPYDRSEVLTVVTVTVTIFWDMTPCSLIFSSGGTCCLLLQYKWGNVFVWNIRKICRM